MPAADLPPRVQPEERYQAELAATEVSPVVARAMIVVFVAVLFIVPLSQAVLEASRGELPAALTLFQPGLAAMRSAFHGDWTSARRQTVETVSGPRLHDFEAGLERRSWPSRPVQQHLQAALTTIFWTGNNRVAVGREGWLFYEPGIDYVAGRDFTNADTIAALTKRMVNRDGEADPQPDPRPAILTLHRALAAAGIRLLVVPVPDKAMVHQDRLAFGPSGLSGAVPPNNIGFANFIGGLRHEGIDILDLSADLDGFRYLAQDTHWTPETMERVATQVAARVAPLVGETPTGEWTRRDVTVARVGDLVDMLALPTNQRIYAPQSVTIHPIVDAAGRGWEPNSRAPVLLVGDSFTNIYSQKSLGWGEHSGFAEHLSFALKTPVDVIALNGGGAWTARAELARDDNAARLAATRVVVYQFAIRDLLGQNWRVDPVPSSARILAERRAAPASTSTNAAIESGGAVTLTATVLKTSAVPRPESAAYNDCLAFIKLTVDRVEEGNYVSSEVIAVFVAMQNHRWLPPATFRAGQRLRLRLIPLREADRSIREMQRADEIDDYALTPYFVVDFQPL